MIPACYPIGVEPIDAKELTGYAFEELNDLEDEKLAKTLTSIQIRILKKYCNVKYCNVIDEPNRDEEKMKIIKNYRIFINKIFNNVRASPDDFVSTGVKCDMIDSYWARREKYLTDNDKLTYIFAVVPPQFTSPR